MTARIRLHASEALARDAQTTALYRLSNEVAGRTRMFDIMKIAAEHGGNVLTPRQLLKGWGPESRIANTCESS